MVARKKTSSKTHAPSVDAASLIVVLEDMRSQFTVFGEALQSSREESSRRFEQIDQRFERIDQRFDQIDQRFEQIDQRFEQIDRRFDQHDIRFASLERDVREVRHDLVEVRGTVHRIETALASKVNRDEVESIVQRALTGPA